MYGQTIIGQQGVGCNGAGGGQIYPAYGGYGGQFAIIGATEPSATDKIKTFLDEENSLLGIKNKYILGVAAGAGLVIWAKSARLF